MSPIKRNGVYYLHIPNRSGGWTLRTTKTRDKTVYNGMRRMIAELRDKRRWALLDAMRVRPARLSIGTVYDAYTDNALDALEASLSASKLSAHLDAYVAVLTGLGRSPKYVGGTRGKILAFIAFTANDSTADLTVARLSAWVASLKTTPGTRRQHLYAVTGFARFLCDTGVLKDYPLARVKAPKKNPPRERWETQANDEAIVRAASPKYRALFAFIKATGCDVSSAFRTLRRDIDLDRARARLRGTKTSGREVHEGVIEAWALPYLRERCAGMLPGAHLWPEGTGKPGKHGRGETPTYSVSGAGHHHTKCCKAAKVEDYTLKDARHSVAVRMRFAGYTFEQIAEQLGNSAYQVAEVYARFMPTMDKQIAGGGNG